MKLVDIARILSDNKQCVFYVEELPLSDETRILIGETLSKFGSRYHITRVITFRNLSSVHTNLPFKYSREFLNYFNALQKT